MIEYRTGNLLEAKADAIVNTVNTVGVMGKGIALMFKEAYPTNFKAYAAACKAGDVKTGTMFVTANDELEGPAWIINFPTKEHWRGNSRMEWIESGLVDLRRVIQEKKIRSIALPPLGCGNGGLEWPDVRSRIEEALSDLDPVQVLVYAPTDHYQNVAKKTGVEQLTLARALVAGMVWRYWSLGMDCTILEIQKLIYFVERFFEHEQFASPLNLTFQPGKFGPYADALRHVMDKLDGSYLHCNKRLADASPYDVIWCEDRRRDVVEAFLRSSEAKPYVPVLDKVEHLIEGFESPLGLETLATVAWLLDHQHATPTVAGVRQALDAWPAGRESAERKQRLFTDSMIAGAIQRVKSLAT